MVEDFGPYRIVRKMAVGGMAEIYLAREHGLQGLERTVVIKRILPGHGEDPEFVTMFLDEARLMAALSHPNVAQVFGLGQMDDTYYLVMEYVRGPTLRALLKAARKSGDPALPQPVALNIALCIAQALAYVHSRRDELGRPLKIVHRDINPSNVIVGYEGAVKLIDFGIAKAASKVYETRTGVIKGTFGYSAPEQLTQSALVDHRADVFGLGILLYEMTVGKHPFDATGPSVIERILSAGYKRPRQVVPNFPSSLDSLICQCMAAHPEGRPESMSAVIAELAAYMSRRGIVPTMPTVAGCVGSLVPDTEGERPLKPLGGRPRLSEPSGTQELFQDAHGTGLEAPTARHPGPVFDPDEATEPVDKRVAEMAMALRSAPDPVRHASTDDEATTGYHRRIPTEDLEPPPMGAPRPKRRGGTVLMVLSSAILVVAVGVAAFVTARTFSKGRSAPRGTPDPGAVAPADGSAGEASTDLVLVESTPPGARVHLNGVDVSRVTPSHVLVDGPEAAIRLSLEGFETVEGTVRATQRVAHFTLTARLLDGEVPDAAPDAPVDGSVDAEAIRDAGVARSKTKRRRWRRRPRRRWRPMR